MFGRGDEGQLKELQEQLQRLQKANKSGAAELAAARARCAELEAEAGRLRAEVLAAQASTQRARARQVLQGSRLRGQLFRPQRTLAPEGRLQAPGKSPCPDPFSPAPMR